MASGTLDNLPKDLRKEIEHLERLFTVDGAKLKEVTDHFVNELEKGKHLTNCKYSTCRGLDSMLTASFVLRS